MQKYKAFKGLQNLLKEKRLFNNTKFDYLFVHTYLNTKALVLKHTQSIVVLIDKRCDILKVSSSSIKETLTEIIEAETMLKKLLCPIKSKGISYNNTQELSRSATRAFSDDWSNMINNIPENDIPICCEDEIDDILVTISSRRRTIQSISEEYERGIE